MALRHVKIRIGGTLYGDANWSVGVALARPLDQVIGNQDIVGQDLDFVADAVRGGFNGNIVPEPLRAIMSSSTRILYVRASVVGPDGREEQVSLVDIPEGVQGTGGAGLPAQAAVCCSLRTGRPGGSYRGRLYWPALGVTLSGGRLDANALLKASVGTVGYLESLATYLPGALNALGLKPVVVSTTRGIATRIQEVAVGNRLDTQRRRSEGQQEAYTVAAVAQ